MKKVKFTKDEGSIFYKELTEKINDYFQQNNIPKHGNNLMKFKICTYFGLVGAFYILMLTSSSVMTFSLFYILMSVMVLFTVFNVSHDAAHGVAVKSKWLNKLLFSFSFNLLGNNAYVWGKNHNESHHLYTNIEGSDIDVLNSPLIRMTETQQLKWYHRYQYLYAPVLYLLYSLNWFVLRETLLLFNYSSRTVKIDMPKIEMLKLLFAKLFYVSFMLVVPLYLFPFHWHYVLLAFLLSHFIISIIISIVLGVSHLSDYTHRPYQDEEKLSMSWAKLQMCTSVDYNSDSIFLNSVLGGFNAHTVHHLLPNICHVHYPKVLPIFREVAAKYNITYQEMDYREAIASHFRFLKKMGRNITYIPVCYEK